MTLNQNKNGPQKAYYQQNATEKSDDKNYVAVLVFDTSLTFRTVSDSPQWHGVDSSQALLSEELVTNPLRFVVNKRFVLRWAKGELLRGTKD